MYINHANQWEHEPSKRSLLSLTKQCSILQRITGLIRRLNTPLIIITTISGSASHASEWIFVKWSITKFARPLLYGQLGYDFSSEISPNTTTNVISAVDIATKLNDFLSVAEISGPFVVICHSCSVLSHENSFTCVVLREMWMAWSSWP